MENNEILTEVTEAEAESADTQETTEKQEKQKQEEEASPFGYCLKFLLIAILLGFLAVGLMPLLIVMNM